MKLDKKNIEIRKAAAVAATPFAHDIMSKYRSRGGNGNAAGRLQMLHAKKNAEASVVQNHIHVKISAPKLEPRPKRPVSASEQKTERPSRIVAKDKIAQKETKETIRVEKETIIIRDVVHVIEKQRSLREQAITQPVRLDVSSSAKHVENPAERHVLPTLKQIVDSSNHTKLFNHRQLSSSPAEALIREQLNRKRSDYIQMLQSKLSRPIVIHTLQRKAVRHRVTSAVHANKSEKAVDKPEEALPPERAKPSKADDRPVSHARSKNIQKSKKNEGTEQARNAMKDIQSKKQRDENSVIGDNQRDLSSIENRDSDSTQKVKSGKLVLQPREATKSKRMKPLQLTNARRGAAATTQEMMGDRSSRPPSDSVAKQGGGREASSNSSLLPKRLSSGNEEASIDQRKTGATNRDSSEQTSKRSDNRGTVETEKQNKAKLNVTPFAKKNHPDREAPDSNSVKERLAQKFNVEASLSYRSREEKTDESDGSFGNSQARQLRLVTGNKKRRKAVMEHLSTRKPLQISHSSRKLSQSFVRNPDVLVSERENQAGENMAPAKEIKNQDAISNPAARYAKQKATLEQPASPSATSPASKLVRWKKPTAQTGAPMIVVGRTSARADSTPDGKPPFLSKPKNVDNKTLSKVANAKKISNDELEKRRIGRLSKNGSAALLIHSKNENQSTLHITKQDQNKISSERRDSSQAEGREKRQSQLRLQDSDLSRSSEESKKKMQMGASRLLQGGITVNKHFAALITRLSRSAETQAERSKAIAPFKLQKPDRPYSQLIAAEQRKKGSNAKSIFIQRAAEQHIAQKAERNLASVNPKNENNWVKKELNPESREASGVPRLSVTSRNRINIVQVKKNLNVVEASNRFKSGNRRPSAMTPLKRMTETIRTIRTQSLNISSNNAERNTAKNAVVKNAVVHLANKKLKDSELLSTNSRSVRSRSSDRGGNSNRNSNSDTRISSITSTSSSSITGMIHQTANKVKSGANSQSSSRMVQRKAGRLVRSAGTNATPALPLQLSERKTQIENQSQMKNANQYKSTTKIQSINRITNPMKNRNKKPNLIQSINPGLKHGKRQRETQNSTPNNTPKSTQITAQNNIQSKAKSKAQSKALNNVQSKAQSKGQNNKKNIVQSKALSKALNNVQSKGQSKGQSNIQNKTQSKALNNIQNNAQNKVQSKTQNNIQSTHAQTSLLTLVNQDFRQDLVSEGSDLRPMQSGRSIASLTVANAGRPLQQTQNVSVERGSGTQSSKLPSPVQLSYKQSNATPTVEQTKQVKIEAPKDYDPEKLQSMIMKMPQMQPEVIADRVYKALEKKMKLEQRRRGL